jgi:hypothetical protein
LPRHAIGGGQQTTRGWQVEAMHQPRLVQHGAGRYTSAKPSLNIRLIARPSD